VPYHQTPEGQAAAAESHRRSAEDVAHMTARYRSGSTYGGMKEYAAGHYGEPRPAHPSYEDAYRHSMKQQGY